MRKTMLYLCLLLFSMAAQAQQCGMEKCKPQCRKAPVKMILDADFGSSTDDLFALMMLNHYIDEGRVDLKGIVVDREGDDNAGVVDIFNTYYGHPDIPVGLERNGVKNPRCFIPYNGICKLKDAQGQPLFKRSFDSKQCMDGYKLYRKLLSKADDKSITVVAIGFVTTLSQLFDSQADEFSNLTGLELFEKKVKAVYMQAGRFEENDSLSGYNLRAASKQADAFFKKFPKSVDIIMSPSNIGDGMNYLPEDVLADLKGVEVNPIKAVYTNYTCDTGQRMWDTNSLVNAVMGNCQYMLSPRGWMTFVEKGEESLLLYRKDTNGNARYQLPGDSYFNTEKLMDIRRYNRMPAQRKCCKAARMEALQADLNAAIVDARQLNESKVVNNLTPVKKGTPGEEWTTIDGRDMVLCVTLVDTSRMNRFFGRDDVYRIERRMGTWITLPVEWAQRKDLFEGLDSVAAHERLIQLFGLSPDCTYDVMVQFYADPASMFRPAHDPSINTTSAGITYPKFVKKNYMVGATNFREWYEESVKAAFEDDSPLPWTQCGYTYDWNRDARRQGLSEYIVGDKALVKVKSRESAWQFIKNLNK